MIFAVIGYPEGSYWSIRKCISKSVPGKLGVVDTLYPGKYEVYLDDSPLKSNDDITLELLHIGRKLIYDKFMEDRSTYWRDEFGKVRL